VLPDVRLDAPVTYLVGDNGSGKSTLVEGLAALRRRGRDHGPRDARALAARRARRSVVRTALVTGANRGIGLEVARGLGERGFRVLAGARDRGRGEEAAEALRRAGHDARAVVLDVADSATVGPAVEAAEGRLDVVVNNAGIYPGGRPSELDLDVAEQAWQVNALGAWRVAQAAIPLMRERGSGRIVNVSSGAGSLASMDASMPAYNVSKAALNAMTRVLAAELRGSGILVNAVCPGWVRTDMGGPGAPRSPEEGAASVLWAVDLPDDGPTGGFFRDGRPVPW
jgi:NAD(P)-dependent dehydrogenase (short-subunit alcohol dehydrogenase family)